ncbi:chaperone protein dnaJ 11, chloroplastic [Carica papaya]|uniref:chaperone protein dnaJ 11, chloroplastic n=1 Tax=Carica papaya TaxID=3649 RepID=UPI000B8CC794|nr:chaperone protein dnaJ 11, chloroplastic [Carica papaya]
MLYSSTFSPSILSLPPNSNKSPTPAPSRTGYHPPRATATATSSTCSTYLNSHGMASSCTSLYDILGIPVGATSQEIKSAYRRLARVCHPDVVATDRKDSSAGEFMKIHDAYSTLSDPEKRAVYDRRFARRGRPLNSAVSSGFSSYTRRNWETDQCW